MMHHFAKFVLANLCACLFLSSQASAEYDTDIYYERLANCHYEDPDLFWIGADYLYWQIQKMDQPVPLVVTAPTAFNGAPLIGVPGTTVVLGGQKVDNEWRSGGRITFGFWLDTGRNYGLEANYFFLPNDSTSRSVASSGLPGSPFLSVPYFDTTTGLESSSPVASPLSGFAGQAVLDVESSMQGAEINGFNIIASLNNLNITGLLGFRYLNFFERLTLSVNSPALALPGEIYQVTDEFTAENNYYGAQIGLGFDFYYSRFFMDAKFKIAVGGMYEDLKVRGQFVTNNFNGLGTPLTYAGGYFALPSNSGKQSNTSFSLLPEANFNIGYQIWDSLSIRVGYSCLYVNKIVRPGKQLNRNINPTQSSLYEFTATPTLVGAPNPQRRLVIESLWAQGVNIGLEYQF